MASSFECVECKHAFDKPHDPLLTIGSFVLFIIAIGFLFGFFPISIGLFLLIWWMNQNKCPKCKSKRIINASHGEKKTEVHHQATELPAKKQSMSGLKVFVIGLSAFLVISLGSLMILVANTPKPPELTQEQKDAMIIAQLATNDLMDSFVISTSIYQDSIGTPNLKMVTKNTSALTIDGIEVMMSFTNNFDEPVAKWNQGNTSLFIAQSQETIAPGETRTGSWNLAAYESATKVTNVRVYRVHYSDGTTMERYFPPSE